MQNSDYMVLVIDEDVSTCRRFSKTLQASHFRSHTCSDAHSALSYIERSPPDLVITEWSINVDENLSILKILNQRYPTIPVIITSKQGAIEDVISALRLGAIDYFIKPIIDTRVLSEAVCHGLERRHLLAQPSHNCSELEATNAQLRLHITEFEQDQRAGSLIQQSMLPMSPFIARDYKCTHKVIPALFLSGDCIDYALLDKRYFAFYIADVSGHGSAPAFVTIWLKNLVAQLVRLRQLLADFRSISNALHELIAVINDELIAMRLNNHITMILGIVDTQTNELFYIVAGHLPLPVVVSKGQAHYLEGRGKPLGLFADNEWDIYQYKLPEVFSLVAFSDGILEVLSGNDLLAKEKTLLKSLSKTDASIESITDELKLLTLDRIPDDIAILTISRGLV
ncbi:MAG: sigma-B regulation protein RsbU (phosphoserine phosphatase) [Kiritimatiellia bacterium]